MRSEVYFGRRSFIISLFLSPFIKYFKSKPKSKFIFHSKLQESFFNQVENRNVEMVSSRPARMPFDNKTFLGITRAE